MKLIGRHLPNGLFYARSLRLIPSIMGTIIPFFWQLVNLYGFAPAVFIIFCVLQMLTVSFAAIMYPLLFFQLSFIKVYYLAVLLW
ncbi:MAG: hypothetical protein ACOX6E_10510 [Syntrophomonadaceae bacterium]